MKSILKIVKRPDIKTGQKWIRYRGRDNDYFVSVVFVNKNDITYSTQVTSHIVEIDKFYKDFRLVS